MAGRVEVAVLEGAPGFALRERLTDRLGPATAPTHRLEVTLRARADRRGADPAERHHPLRRHRHRRLPRWCRSPAARRSRAGEVRAITGYSAPEFGDRLGLREPRRRATTPSGGWRSTSPTASCSGWRSPRRELDVKLAGRDAARFLARPDPAAAGVLLYGADADAGGAEARGARRGADRARRRGRDAARPASPAPTSAATRRRLDATEGDRLLPRAAGGAGRGGRRRRGAGAQAALEDWRPGDAPLVVTAGGLGAGQRAAQGLRGGERGGGDRRLRRPARPRRGRGGARRRPGWRGRDREAMAAVEALAQALDPGDFAQFLAKLALYKRGDPAPLTAADLAACAPPAGEAEIDAVVALAADGDAARLAAALRAGARRQPDRRSPSPPAATSARCTPPPAPPTGPRRPSRAPGRRSSGRGGRGWRRRPAPSAATDWSRRSA